MKVRIEKIVIIVTGDLDFIENNASDTYPNAVWVSKEQLKDEDIKSFLEYYPKELELLEKDKIDYILIEYDM